MNQPAQLAKALGSLEAIQKDFNGSQSGGVPLLEDGMELRESKAFSPQDAQDLEGRRLTAVEVAAAYVFLASDEASYVSGTVVGVTGGKPVF